MPDRDKPLESQKYVESLMKGLEILDSLQGRAQMTLTEIASELGMYKSRVMRLCGTLERMGYVVFDGPSRVYSLGPRIPALARVYEDTNPILAVARPTLERLFKEIRQSVAFHKIHDKGLICVIRLSRGVANHDQEPVWRERDLHCGARGRVMLAFSSDEFRENFFAISERYPALTPFTITTREKLASEVEKTRRMGYALTSEERELGRVGIAAPVFQYSNDLVGVISISGDINEFGKPSRKKAIRMLLDETAKLSSRLGADKGGDAAKD
ncbi:MAG: IclR family transcriptional regulator [Synergistaceae bacterium]|jgi:DNA-binding IclR family transcriptional regulator|nr:IclR family transcriptional regulator [Synergistaceae bacterium]